MSDIYVLWTKSQVFCCSSFSTRAIQKYAGTLVLGTQLTVVVEFYIVLSYNFHERFTAFNEMLLHLVLLLPEVAQDSRYEGLSRRLSRAK
jgi:hypothetical protein